MVTNRLPSYPIVAMLEDAHCVEVIPAHIFARIGDKSDTGSDPVINRHSLRERTFGPTYIAIVWE